MFAQIKIVECSILLLLLSVEFSVARLGQNCKKENRLDYSMQNTEARMEDNILKGVVYPIDVNRKIGEVIFDVLCKNPDHVSQIDAETGNQTTFKEMKDRSIRLAAWMKKLGVDSNDIIVEVSHNHMDSYLPFLATFFVDAIFSGWTTNIRVDTARLLIQQYTPKVIFADEKAASVLLEAATLENSNVKIIVFGKHSSLQSFSEIMNLQAKDDVENFKLINKKTPQEAAVILLTSGTTSFPKGVVYSSKSLLAIALGHESVYLDVGVFNGATHLWYADLSWNRGVWLALQTIVKRDIRIIAAVSDENQFFQTVEKYKINVAMLPVSLVHPITRSEPTHKYNVQSMQMIVLNGLKFSREVLERLQQIFRDAFIQYSFGATEMGGAITLRTRKYKNLESVGFPIPNAEVKFVDLESNKTLGPHQRGEIYAKTLAMTTGYYKNPDATKKAFDAQGWYHTGDLGYYDENGEIFIVGRLKNIVKQKNHTIELSKLQYTLSTHPDVEAVGVVSIPYKSIGELPVAFVKRVSGSNVSEDELMKLLSVLEPFRGIEVKIYFIDKFPQTGSGKIAEGELKQLAEKMVNST